MLENSGMESAAYEAHRDEDAAGAVDKLNAISRRKLSLLYELYNISSQAVNYISEDSVEQLDNLYEAKQELIREIDSIDVQFLADFDRLKAGLGVASIEDIPRGKFPRISDLHENTGEILDILKKIESLDKRASDSIIKLRAAIADDLIRIRRQKNIVGKYEHDRTQPQHSNKGNKGISLYSPGFDIKN